MSVLSAIGNSKGRFSKKRRPKGAASPGKERPAKTTVSTAPRSDPRSPRKGEAVGDGEKLVRMKRLRDERESLPEPDEEKNGDMIRRMGGDPVLAQVEDEEDAIVKAGHASAQPDAAKPGAGGPTETRKGSGAPGDAPCAVPSDEAPRSSDDSGFFGDLFTTVIQEEATPIESLTASISDVSADELVAEAARIKSMARRTPRAGA